ncbi:hypothetical protein [Sphingobacterium sp. IITKGP-BTPF85]|uniref:hypothetical protein n=1 Tax=Sphingobacterium sp. IITKGP-BTPF85 TaxID=1338009 RepID=UPI00038A419E|nr:hypothetical protein [Sphingobacterium sp. IITKGP-BTPF85]KKX50403.1 hypothetical protein L950_0210745 [Sphingobacterium sp. IITKGP-BTPF85]
MEQPLSISILDYFKRVHEIELMTSNAELLLSALNYFKVVHTGYKEDFNIRKAGGNSYETILEMLVQDIHRIEQSHALYIANGNLITELTKQYTIEQNNKAYTNTLTTTQDIDYNKIEQIVKVNTPTAKQTGKAVYEELFISNVKKDKKDNRDNDDYLRDLQLVEQQAKALAKAKK